MSSFLDRLKKKDVIPVTPDDEKRAKIAAQVAAQPTVQENAISAEQLKVDIYRAQTAIVIYAQIGGAHADGIEIIIEGDDDVVTIKGQRAHPSGDHLQNFSTDGKEKVLEECSWGNFYRQIILPAEVDPTKTEAAIHEGVLMLSLPLRATKDTGVRIGITKV